MNNNTITESDWLDTFHAWKVLDDLLRAESYAEIIDALKQVTPEIRDRLDKVVSKLQDFVEEAPEEEEPPAPEPDKPSPE